MIVWPQAPPLGKCQLVDRLAEQLARAGLPSPVRDYRWALPRRWTFALAWPAYRVAVDLEPGLLQARHVRGRSLALDGTRHNATQDDGWRVFRFAPAAIADGSAAALLAQALGRSRGAQFTLRRDAGT